MSFERQRGAATARLALALVRCRARSALLQSLFVAGFAASPLRRSSTLAPICRRATFRPISAFSDNVAGFDINQSLIPYSAASTYGRAFFVGLLNTLPRRRARRGLCDAPRLSRRRCAALAKTGRRAAAPMPMSRRCATCRCCCSCCSGTMPCLKPLPAPRQSFALPFGVFLNNRGLFVPQPVSQPGALWVVLAALVSFVAAIGLRWLSHQAQISQARARPLSAASPRLSSSSCRSPPSSGRAARLLSCGRSCRDSTSAAASGSARIRRAAFSASASTPRPSSPRSCAPASQAVPRGQREAAAALGLTARRRAASSCVPQAMRLIVPPADQPISEPHQEFIARRVHRLSRSRAGLRRHGAEPDRRGGAGHLHHHGCLSLRSRSSASLAMNLLQRALHSRERCIGGSAMSGGPRRAARPDRRAARRGAEGRASSRLARKLLVRRNRWRSRLALLVLPSGPCPICCAISSSAPSGMATPRPAAPRAGACWAFIADKLPYFIYGPYPARSALAGRSRLRPSARC